MHVQTPNKTLRGLSFLFSRLPSAEKWLHFTTISWVIFQLLTSAGMHVSKDATVYHLTLIDHIHMYGGIGLLLFSMVFFVTVVNRRPITDMYPWLFGNFTVIKADLLILRTGRLPEPKPAGLAAMVEGLGLLALMLATVTGTLWAIAMLMENPLSPDFLAIHKTAVGAIEAYIWGHGLFALLHLIIWWRR
ncbi:hypothetical protein RN22_11840 [Grimontia sp. AD028]|uniref:Cytochrome b561 bacterial/Ni-hydrogenase domain-containing protein n=1 Tax=Grimontia sedimenti TaxID=2711294 RepID=A0A6M1RCN5_9GAMM|nr:MULTISPECIES: hypothetical protein [Grimontia]KKD60246.1 hypothetical protein RN22_11840 [Grimontia sp. AD028]NGN97202.1 hypothetical protein [Grimontia sedimenti]